MLTPLNLKRIAVLISLSSMGFLNSGCEDQSQANLASAQSCLDSATTTSQANACAAQIANDHSADAYLIRCSANFIAQGVTGDRLANAYKQMDSSTNASNKTTALMAYMIFDDTLAGNTSSETVLNCQLSGISSMYQLASAAALATTLANVAGSLSGITGVPLASLLPDASGNINPTNLQTAITSLEANLGSVTAGDETTIGSAVINANDALCAAGSSFSTQDVCTKIASAMSANGGTPADIGSQLLTLLQSGQ